MTEFSVFHTREMGHHIISLFEGDTYAQLVEAGVAIHPDEDIDPEYDLDLLKKETLRSLKELDISKHYTCGVCKLAFQNVEEQRNHFKMAFHIYNVKQGAAGLPPISEDVYLKREENLIIDSESEPDSAQCSDESLGSESEDSDVPVLKVRKSARMYFTNSFGKCFGIYSCLIHKKKERPSSHEILKLVKECHKKPLWIVLLTGGGHFAGAVFQGTSIILHKTIHSYTVRGNQGNTQSKKDGMGRHPKSAGANLRRSNEDTFSQNVLELLHQWKTQFAACHVIFYHAVGHNQKFLFGDLSPIDKTDVRVRSIPVSSHKATYKEVIRVHKMLTTVEVFDSQEAYKKFTATKEPSTQQATKPKSLFDRAKSRKSPARPNPCAPSSESSADEENEFIMSSELMSLSFKDELEECSDTVPSKIKKKWRSGAKPCRGKKRNVAAPADAMDVCDPNPVPDGDSAHSVWRGLHPSSPLRQNLNVESSENAAEHFGKSRMDTKQPESFRFMDRIPRNVMSTDSSPETENPKAMKKESSARKSNRKKKARKRKAKFDTVQQPRDPMGTRQSMGRQMPGASLGSASSVADNVLCNQCLHYLYGKVPFEYSDFKFCSIQCLQLHRNSYKKKK